MTLFKKRKKESVAIPFLISMIVTLLIIGIPVFTFYNHLITEKESTNAGLEDVIFTPTNDNDTTLLFVYEPNDKSLRPSFLILRTSAMNKSFTFIPVSNDLLCGSEKMSAVFKNGGIIELTKAVEKTFETDIDRYMLLNDEALSVICDSFGGVNFAVPEGLKGLNEGTQFLDSGFILKLISNPKFAEDARTVATGNLFADMLSGASGTRVADIAEYTYNKVINMVETDITSIDYENQKKAVDYIFRSNQYISTYRVPSGKPSGDGIALDPSSLKQIKNDSGLQ